MPLFFQVIALIAIVGLIVWAVERWLPPLIPQPFLNIILLIIVLFAAYYLGMLVGIW